MKCEICGKKDYEINTQKFPKTFCSYKCYEEWLKFNKPPNCKCPICGKEFYIKPSRIKKLKNGATCSVECAAKFKSIYFKKEGNHQYGLIGDLNASSKGNLIINQYGYILEYCLGHPRPNDTNHKGARVLQHRLVIEKNYKLFDDNFFENIGGWIILKKEYDVHHINENKTDNRLENLKIVSKSEHRIIHNKLESIKLKKYNSIIGVLKQGELLETLGVDNQQPSLNSNVFEGSTTNNRVQTSNVEDSNIDTSALLEQIVKIVQDDIV